LTIDTVPVSKESSAQAFDQDLIGIGYDLHVSVARLKSPAWLRVFLTETAIW
jgi:hypothetical protein